MSLKDDLKTLEKIYPEEDALIKQIESLRAELEASKREAVKWEAIVTLREDVIEQLEYQLNLVSEALKQSEEEV